MRKKCSHCGKPLPENEIGTLTGYVLAALSTRGRPTMTAGTTEIRASWNAIHSPSRGSLVPMDVMRSVIGAHLDSALPPGDWDWCCRADVTRELECKLPLREALDAKLADMIVCFGTSRLHDLKDEIRRLLRFGFTPEEILRQVHEVVVEDVQGG